MGLFLEMRKELGAEGELNPFRVQYSVVDGKGGYFLNVKHIREFSETKIVLQGREGTVTVEGENLCLGKYDGGDVTVFGNVKKVERG